MTDAAYPDWDAVYRDNVTWVYRLMYSKVGNQPDAEDLTAEVFMTALKPLRVSATVPEVRKYLKMTARTVLASYWRDRMGRQITTIEEDLPDESGQEDHRIGCTRPGAAGVGDVTGQLSSHPGTPFPAGFLGSRGRGADGC